TNAWRRRSAAAQEGEMFTLHSILVFLHVLGAMGIFATLGIEAAALQRFRAAATPGQIRSTLEIMKTTRRLGGPSMLTMLVTGIWMTVEWWRGQAWTACALGAVVLIAVLGGVLTGRAMRRIGPALANETGDQLSNTFRALQSGGMLT